MSNMKLAFILEAIDKATEPMRRVGRAVDQINEPAKRVSRSMSDVGYRFGRLMGNRLARQWGDVAESGSKLRETGQGIAQVLGAITVAAGGAFYAMKRTVDQVDRANDTAKKLGMPVEMYQKMGYAAKMNGSSQEEMGQSLQFLSQNMAEAMAGSKEATEWFNRVGISLQQLKKMNVGQAFEAIADKFQAVGDTGRNSAQKIAAMKALMGRGGAELRQVLDLGSAGLHTYYKEAEKLGVVIDGPTAEAMSDFNDNFDRLQESIFGVMSAITKRALPALDALVQKLTAGNVANMGEWGKEIGTTISNIIEGVPSLLKELGKAFGAIALVASIVNTVVGALGGWETVIYAVSTVLGAKLAIGIFSVVRALLVMIPTIWSIGAAIMATPLGWFMAAIALIAGAAYLIYRYWEPIKGFFAGLWDGVKSAFVAVYDFIAGKLGAILEFANTVINTVKNAFTAGGSTGEMQHDALGNPTGAMAGSALPTGASSKTDVGGTLKIQIDQEGRARVAEVTSNSKGVDFDVYSGMTMVGA